VESEQIINDCNNIDREDVCEYCGGKVTHVSKGDEVAKVCQDCGMIDPR